jgi:uncharacterized protein (TIGR02246 family)
MDQKITRCSSRSWAVVGISAAVITLAIPLTINQLRQNKINVYEESKTTKPLAARSESAEISASAPDKTIEDLVRAWNQGSTDEIAKMFASDGVLVIPAGSQIQSRAEINKAILERRTGVLKDTTLSNTVTNVSQPDGNRATVKGTYQLEGIKILGFTKSASGSYILHQVKHEGQWLISHAEVTTGNQS